MSLVSLYANDIIVSLGWNYQKLNIYFYTILEMDQ